MPNSDQLIVMLVTLILFAYMLRQRFSLKVLLTSALGGGLTLVGELNSGVFWLYSLIDGLITFMMWYILISGFFLIVAFFSRDRRS